MIRANNEIGGTGSATEPGEATLDPVEAQAGKPLYVVAREAIRRAIDSGRFGPGQRMPSTAQISRQMKVSLVTAHRALGELVGDGLLDRTQGRGTFVSRSIGDATRPSRATGRVGLVVHRESSLADHYHGQVLEGVRRAARKANLDLVLLRFGDDLRGECDGFLWVNPLPGELGDMLGRAGKRPCVVVGADVSHLSDADRASVLAVDTDNRGLARAAADHLLDLGHRRLGFVGGGDGPAATSNARDRWHGFEAACRDRGVELTAAHVLHARGWRLEVDERRHVAEMLRGTDAPTALFAAGYYYALDVYASALLAKRIMPRDLSVIGVDDPPSALHLSPSLTTLRQPLVRLGHAAVAAIVRQLSDGDVDRPRSLRGRVLKAKLVARDSTGPASA